MISAEPARGVATESVRSSADLPGETPLPKSCMLPLLTEPDEMKTDDVSLLETRTRWTSTVAVNSARSVCRHFLERWISLPDVSLRDFASKTWEVAPGCVLTSRPAFYLPNQIERITGSAYRYHWFPEEPTTYEYQLAGGIQRYQSPTTACLLKEAFLVDGAIHLPGLVHRLYPRAHRYPPVRVETEVARAAVHATWDGNLFFGLWLTDDCTLYPLAESEGIPIVTAQPPRSAHKATYEEWLGMRSTRLSTAYLREVVLFEDLLQNASKHARFQRLKEKLLSRLKVESHPGVFIIRGGSGKRRNMHNELELADYLKSRRGFRVVDINVADVPTILAACAGARMIVGVEGSHLVHGLMVLEPGAGVLTLQPPNRFCVVIKRTTDRDGQDYGFVVGLPRSDGFWVDPVEVEQTLDLFPQSQRGQVPRVGNPYGRGSRSNPNP